MAKVIEDEAASEGQAAEEEAVQVIRGALILGAGFVLGYAKAMHDTPEVKVFIRNVWGEIQSNAARYAGEYPNPPEPESTVSSKEPISNLERNTIHDNTIEGESHA